jgi:hypothetical protein
MCVRAFHRPPLTRQAALAGFMKLNWTGSECWPVATRPVYLLTRNGIDWAGRYPRIMSAVNALRRRWAG